MWLKICRGFFCALLLVKSTLAASTEITLATLNWEPVYGENLPENGFFTAITKEAFKRAGYDLKVKFLPWKRALEQSKKGTYDGILGAYYNEDRAKSFYYSDPVYQSDEVFVQLKGKGISYKTLQDLKPYKIGGVLGGAPSKELQSLGLNLEETVTTIQSLRKLNAKRVDLVVVGRAEFHYRLNTVEDLVKVKNKFDVIEPPFKSYQLYCPITKVRADGQEVVNKFNQAISEMKADGSFEAILSRFGQNL